MFGSRRVARRTSRRVARRRTVVFQHGSITHEVFTGRVIVETTP